jgi:carbamoyltransferase
VDGVPVAAIAEERLNRIKNFGGFPKLSLIECLRISGLSIREVDIVTVGREPTANRLKKYLYAARNVSNISTLFQIKRNRNQLGYIKNIIARECNFSQADLGFSVQFVEHHLAHTASAYFISPWDLAAGITIDGSGDFVTCMMTRCEGPYINIIERVFVPHSLGSFYTAICQFIGYGQVGDEGKVMGLAPLGEDNYSDLFEDMVILTKRGIALNLEYFLPLGSNQGMTVNDDGTAEIAQLYSSKLTDRIGLPRQPSSVITKRDQDLASSLQTRFESAYIHLVNCLHNLTPNNRIVMAGGCALNSVANGKLFQETPFSSTCIQPAAGDDGLALGAALYVSNTILKESNRWTMENAFLGPEFSDEIIESVLIDSDISYQKLDRISLIKFTANQISSGKIIGWFQGKMEWGPRALGNRSILAHPGLPTTKETLNARIKQRESFRPFAPAVLEEFQPDIFDQTHPSPFMLHVYKIKPAWRERLIAVSHVDNSGRLQSVSRKQNPLFYELILEFYKTTGIPVLLNTSFNENEPIVCSPSEAVSCFQRTKMDVLAIGPFMCTKS